MLDWDPGGVAGGGKGGGGMSVARGILNAGLPAPRVRELGAVWPVLGATLTLRLGSVLRSGLCGAAGGSGLLGTAACRSKAHLNFLPLGNKQASSASEGSAVLLVGLSFHCSCCKMYVLVPSPFRS